MLRQRRVVEQIGRIGRMFDKSRSLVLATQGPTHRIAYAKAAIEKLASRPAVIGEKLSDIYPESLSNGTTAIANRVFQTGEGI